MKKIILLLVTTMLFLVNTYAQLSLQSGNSNYLINFSTTVSGVNSGSFTGGGFTTNPNNGQLDADAWATTGFSDGAKSFGAVRTSGDHARGASNGAVSSGGIYGFDVGAGNRALGIQPTGSDWTPGTITLKIVNNSTSIVNDMNIDYIIYTRNDQNRASSFNFSYSFNNSSYTGVSSANYTSTLTAGASNWSANNKSIQLSSLNLNPGAVFYIRWSGADAGGSGSRDELALDNIAISISGSGGGGGGGTGYYASIGSETCGALKTALYNLIKGHTSISYGSLWTHYKTTDDHLNDAGNKTIVWDMYSDNPTGSENEFTFVTNQCGTYAGEGSCYNREHSFPKSWWGGSTSPSQYTDIFVVVPADGWVNSVRNNYPFGEVLAGTENQITNNGSKLGNSAINIPGYSGKVFEPIDAYKGDFARGYFYMATRYENVIGGWEGNTVESNSVLDGSSFPVYEPWVINMLLSWHNSDPVDQKEIDRNEAIFGIQGNRNPYIDHPEYVGLVWGSCGGNGGGGGGGSSTVLHEGYFNTGWDGWSDGGGDCYRYGGSRTPEGSHSIRIRDNSGTSSAMTSPSFDLSSYNSVRIDFSFYAYSMEYNEDFWLRYYDGSTWQTIASYARGIDFNNYKVYNFSVLIDDNNYNFPSNAKFRFQCDASSNADQIYMDAIVITANPSGTAMMTKVIEQDLRVEDVRERELAMTFNQILEKSVEDNSFETVQENKIQLYPNPTNDYIYINLEEYKTDVARIDILNLMGQKMKTQTTTVSQGILRKDVSHLASGMYLLRIIDEKNQQQTMKFYVQ